MFGPVSCICKNCSVIFESWDREQAKHGLCVPCTEKKAAKDKEPIRNCKIRFLFFKPSGKFYTEGVEEFNDYGNNFELIERLKKRHAADDLPGIFHSSQYLCVLEIEDGANSDMYPAAFTPTSLNGLDLRATQKAQQEWAIKHGFWDGTDLVMWDRDNLTPSQVTVLGMKLMLAVSEIGEAFEELRCQRPLFWESHHGESRAKPEGFGVELADAMLILCSIGEAMGIDLGDMMQKKFAYNQIRPHKNGKLIG